MPGFAYQLGILLAAPVNNMGMHCEAAGVCLGARRIRNREHRIIDDGDRARVGAEGQKFRAAGDSELRMSAIVLLLICPLTPLTTRTPPPAIITQDRDMVQVVFPVMGSGPLLSDRLR